MINGQYVKRPTPITAVEAVTVAQLEVLDAAGRLSWRHNPSGCMEVYNAKAGAWFPFSFGDVFNVSDPGDVYVIPRDVFERTYDAVDDGK